MYNSVAKTTGFFGDDPGILLVIKGFGQPMKVILFIASLANTTTKVKGMTAKKNDAFIFIESDPFGQAPCINLRRELGIIPF